MASNKDLYKEFGVKEVIKWAPREESGAPLITMPNIPKPLHGRAPRVVLGDKWWNLVRKHCYLKADDTCEICGEKPEHLRNRHAHELYKINYRIGTSEFIKPVCVCYTCHCLGIHTGRALTLYKQGNPLFPKEALLNGAEHAFKLVSDWNKAHPKKTPLRVYATWLEYLRQPELEKPMRELIEKYNIKFYTEKESRCANWGDWKLIIAGNEYPTPYANEKEWEKAMEEASKNDSYRIYGVKKKKFTSTDDVEISADDIIRINQAEIPEGF